MEQVRGCIHTPLRIRQEHPSATQQPSGSTVEGDICTIPPRSSRLRPNPTDASPAAHNGRNAAVPRLLPLASIHRVRASAVRTLLVHWRQGSAIHVDRV